MSRLFLTASILVAATAAATPAAATTFTTEGGFVFDIQDGEGAATTTEGAIAHGTDGAYIDCYRLQVSGSYYSAPAGSASLDGRTVRLPAVKMGLVDVARAIYVPSSGGDYVRYLDTFMNDSDADVGVSLAYSGRLGSGSSTTVWATYSGDAVPDPSDFWYGTDDADREGLPTLAHVFLGDEAAHGPESQSVAMGSISSAFSITVPARSTVALLVFGIQGNSRSLVRAQLDAIFRNIEALTSDLDDAELRQILNWRLAGAPFIRWVEGQTFSMAEGGELELGVVVTDREGDPTTVLWDLDGDGDFGDATGENVVASAMGLDGPTTLSVSVRATDSGGLASQLSATIEVDNAPPRFTSTPPEAAGVSAEWTYEPVVEDPGGHDGVVVTLEEGPEEMTLGEDGIVRWTPAVEDIGEVAVVLRATDDDDDPGVEGDGDATQGFTLAVGEGVPLGPPLVLTPERGEVVRDLRPTIRVQNPDDPNGGLEIYFELDDQPSFPSPIASGPVRAGGILSEGIFFMPVEPDDTTTWTIDQDLEPGQYHLRAWGSDIYGEGPRTVSQFWVDLDGGDGDGDGDGDGCACRAAPPAGPGSLAWLLLVVLSAGRRALRTAGRRASRRRR